MLNDSYVEHAVQSKPESNFYLGVGGGIVLILLGLYIFLTINLIGIAILLIGACMVGYFGQAKSVEYEYIITNGNVDISAIYGASRRKQKMQFDASKIQMMVPKDSNRLGGNQFDQTRDYTSKRKDEPGVALVVEVNEKKELVLMEMNEKCINHMKLYLRNKIYDL